MTNDKSCKSIRSSFSVRLSASRQGFGLIEIVIVCGIIAMTFAVFTRAEILALRLLRAEQEDMEATLLAGEALEAVRSVRDESWEASIAWRTQGPLASPSLRYYPVVIASKWSLATSSPGLVNGTYNRYVIFEKVSRDPSSDDIVSSGGTDDAGTRKVTSQVQWGAKIVTLVSYITNFQASLTLPMETKVSLSSNEDAPSELNFNFPSGNGSGDLTQSFTAPATAIKVSRIDLLLRRDTPSAPSDVYVELRTNALGTVLGTSTKITSTTIATSSAAWIEFRFQNFVPLSANKIYTIRLASAPNSTNNGSGGAGLLFWRYKSSNPYAGGVASSSVGHLSNPNYGGTLWSNYDLGFRVYSSP